MNRERIASIRAFPQSASPDDVVLLAALALAEERYRHALFAILTKAGSLKGERGGAMADIHEVARTALGDLCTEHTS